MKWALPLLMVGCGAVPESAPVGTLRLKLTASVEACADFCADQVGAEVYREGESIPIGPGQVVTCGEDIEFDHIPAGHNVVLKAWVGAGPVHVLDGQSGVIVVPANAVAEVEIALAPKHVPHIAAISPDPVVIGADGADVTIVGDGLGVGAGLSRVMLGDTVLGAEWTDGAVTAHIPPGATGTALRVQSCGVMAEGAAEVRIAGPELSAATSTPPGCTGFAARAATAAPGGDVWLAAGCGPGAGSLVRFVASSCTLGATATPLAGEPLAIDTSPDGTVVVALAGPSAVLVVPPTGDPHALPGLPPGHTPIDVAVSPVMIYAVLSDPGGATTLWALGATPEPLENVTGDLRDAVAAGGSVLLCAVKPGGDASLVAYNEKTHGDANLPLDGCQDPRRIAASATWAAVSCAGAAPAIVAVPLIGGGEPQVHPLAAAPEAIALDPLGDVAFVWEPGAGQVEAVALATGQSMGPWSLQAGDGPLVSLPDGRLLLGGPAPGALTVLAPYGGALPCPGGGGM